MRRIALLLAGVSAASLLGSTVACNDVGFSGTGGAAPSSSDSGGGRDSSNGGGGGASTTGDSGGSDSSSGGAAGSGGSGGSVPATCNGYEPCGVNQVVIPDGYALAKSPGITVFNQAKNVACTDFADCDMWNAHFDAEWDAATNEGYNRMGSPFPWSLSRYIVVVPPKTVSYVKFHMTAPGDLYRYSDGTPESKTDKDTRVTTCYQRGPSSLLSGRLGNMGGTGNLGIIEWNVSILPGDMGNSGNASTCSGDGNTTGLVITSDEATAQEKGPTDKYYACLLREGHDYYLNFTSRGMTHTTDCSKSDCTAGLFAFSNGTTADGTPFLNQVPCP